VAKTHVPLQYGTLYVRLFERSRNYLNNQATPTSPCVINEHGHLQDSELSQPL
jgi:hypothetical protein